MTFDLKPLLLLVVLMVFGGLVFWYQGLAEDEKQRADAAERNLKLANEKINDMQKRQRDVAALDSKYTGELADAKKQLDGLQRCVSTGKCGLRINAKCPENRTPGTSGMDDGSGPRLTDSAERDYFTLRERIETITRQLTGLQEYVHGQCLK